MAARVASGVRVLDGRGARGAGAPLTFAAIPGLYGIGFGVANPLVPLFIISIGGSSALVAANAVIGVAVNAILRPLIGRWADRRSNRLTVVTLALIPGVAALGAMAVVSDPWLVIPLSVLIGAGAATFWPSLRAAAIETSDGAAQRALGRIGAAQEAGGATGQLLAGVCLALFTFHQSFLVAATTLALSLCVAAVSSRRNSAIRPPLATDMGVVNQRTTVSLGVEDESERQSASRKAETVGAMLVMFCTGAAISAFLPYLSLYLKQRLEAPAIILGFTFAAFSVARFFGGLKASAAAQRLVGRLGARWTLPMLLLVASLLLFGQMIDSLVLFIIFGVVLAFVLTVSQILVLSSVRQVPPRRLASRIGLLEAFSLAGGAIGPIIGGVFNGQAQHWLFSAPAGLALIAAGAALLAPQTTLDDD